MTLAAWAEARGLSVESVRNYWTIRPGFPVPKRTGPGSGSPAEYDVAELDAFAEQWQAGHRPAEFAMPADAEEYRTLGAIARLLGVDGKSVSQYRAAMDEHAAYEDRGQRRVYRTGDVVEVLNSRRGPGRALDAGKDRRRRSSSSK